MSSQAYIGSIAMFAGNFAPRNWALCQGQLMAISQNAALFSILGTTYGGNGTSTFGLPDLRGRLPVGQGAGPGLSQYQLGEMTGAENVTLLQGQMPSHTHLVNATSAASPTRGGTSPAGNILAVTTAGSAVDIYAGPTTTPLVQMAPNMIAAAGNNLPVNVVQPVLCINFIICLYGVFPSRN